MKKLAYMLGIIIPIVMGLFGCEEENYRLDTFDTPINLDITADIQGADDTNPNGDGSGIVTISASADNALSYYFIINDEKIVVPSGIDEFTLPTPGINNYEVDVYAVGSGGATINKSISFDIAYSYNAPTDIIERLTGAPVNDEIVSKTWRIKSELNGHFGLGPTDGEVPTEWYGAGPEEKVGTGMYEDRYTFSSDGTFTHSTEGRVFGRSGLIDELGSVADDVTTTQGDDVLNLPYESYSVPFYYTGSDTEVNVLLSGIGFMGYYIGGNHTYELFSYQNQPSNELILRAIDGNEDFAWWFIITSCEVGEVCEDENEKTLDVIYKEEGEVPFWSDEFDVDGAPDTNNWNYNIGRGSGGWGNNELQYYTDRTENVFISEGTLKIVAKKETYEGALYTSTRMKTQDLFEFTYGRIDISAKMPVGGGTWPALWMLGANIDNVGWPACGEVDILEHVGNDPGIIKHAIHTTSDHGDTQDKGESTVEGVQDDFHLYSVNWSPDEINFLVDDEIIYTYFNSDGSTIDEWPFDEDQFIILNVAMGGTLGGTIDPAFTETTMEVDYVRVYQ